jgi:hypothetical protein
MDRHVIDQTWTNKDGIARHFGCSPRHITNMMARRLLPYCKLGKSVRFHIKKCDDAISSLEIKSQSQLTPRAIKKARHTNACAVASIGDYG